MKKHALILFATLTLWGCSEKVVLFNSKISALDINGTKKFGPKNTSQTSKLIKDPILADPKHQYLGRLISSNNVRDDNAFFSFIFLKGNYGMLDDAYMNYISEYALPNFVIQPTDGISRELLDQFRTEFTAHNSYIKKKEILFKDNYRPIRNKIEEGIYEKAENNIVQTQKVESSFKGSLESNIKSILKESKIEGNAEIKAKFESLIKSNVSISGKYVDIELRQEFVDKMIILLRRLKTNTISPENDFLLNYLDRFVGNGDFVAVGYSLLQFEINYNTSVITKDSIESIINGIANLTPDSKNQVSLKLYASFSSQKDFTGESRSTKNYLVRYAYNPMLQGEMPTDPQQKIASSVIAPVQYQLTDKDTTEVGNEGSSYLSLTLEKNKKYRIQGSVNFEPIDYGSGYYEGNAILISPELNLHNDLGFHLRKNPGDGSANFPINLGVVETDENSVLTFNIKLVGMKWSNGQHEIRSTTYRIISNITATKLN